jgi:hypothetical protein
VDNAVDALDGLIKHAHFLGVNLVKVADLDKVELAGVLWPGFDHGVALGHRAGRTPDSDAPAEQLVDDMGADEAGGAGDQDVLSAAS